MRHYRINVAKQTGQKNFDGALAYAWYCDIDLRDCTADEAFAKHAAIAESFGDKYSVSMTLTETHNYIVA
jgi:hypothetical protein